jgi:hypothetical protein
VISPAKKAFAFALTGPDARADALAIKAVAVRRGDEFLVNGQKMLISNGAIADLFTVIDLTDPEKRVRGGEGVIELQSSPSSGSDPGDSETPACLRSLFLSQQAERTIPSPPKSNRYKPIKSVRKTK